MARSKGSGGTPATVMLTRSGVAFRLHAYEHDAAAASYGLEAAAALGVPSDRVFKTLVAAVDNELTVAIIPAHRQLDLKALAAAVAGKRADLADAAAAERSTGYVVGGISPFGQRRRLRTVVDDSALGHATVFVSGGRRGLEIELQPADLVRLTDAALASIARDGRNPPSTR